MKFLNNFAFNYYKRLQDTSMNSRFSIRHRIEGSLNLMYRNKIIYKANLLTLDLILKAWGKSISRTYNINKTIALVSSQRGGSTWLAEMLGAIPGYITISEPLNLHSNPIAKKYGFWWNDYIPVGETSPLRLEYIRKILNGSALSINIASGACRSLQQLPKEIRGFQGILVKFVHAHMLLDWMLSYFPIRTIFLIRHPCAVVSSQMRWAWEGYGTSPLKIKEEILRDYPHLQNLVGRIGGREEKLALTWALQNYIPLSKPDTRTWYLTTYEALVSKQAEELDNIFNYLGCDIPDATYRHLQQPSKSTASDANIKQGKDPLLSWKQHLTKEQQFKILDIVHEVGIDFYTDDVHPSYELLARKRNFQEEKTRY